MRLLPALFLTSLAVTTAAAPFRNERPLTAGKTAAEQHDAAVSLTPRGVVVVWLNPAPQSAVIKAAPAAARTLDQGDGSSIAVASIGEESLVAAVQGKKLSSWRLDLHGASAGQVIPISDVEPEATVGVGTNGHEYLVAWSGPSGMILGAIVDANGRVLASAQTLVKASSRKVKRIAVASNGSDFFVVWDAVGADEWQTMAVLVSPEGPPRWMLPMPISMSGAAPDVVWNGSEYLIVWQSVPDGGIRGRRVSADGVLRSELLSITTKRDLAPRLAWDGAGYSVAFARAALAGKSSVGSLAVLRVTREGLPAEILTGGALAAGIEPGQYAIAAGAGEVVLVYRKGKGLMFNRTAVGSPKGAPARSPLNRPE